MILDILMWLQGFSLPHLIYSTALHVQYLLHNGELITLGKQKQCSKTYVIYFHLYNAPFTLQEVCPAVTVVRAVRAPKGVNRADWSTSMKFGMDAYSNVMNPFFEGAEAIGHL